MTTSTTKDFVTIISLLILLTVFPEHSLCSQSVTTACGEKVLISNAGVEHVRVILNFSQPQLNGATCSWLIPAENGTMSNQVVLSGAAVPDALSCEKKAFSVSEQDPVSGALNPLTLECMEKSVNPNLTFYKAVIGQPGFSVIVVLNTSSTLLESSFTFMNVLPFVWSAEVCPRPDRKVIIAQPGSKESSDTLNPASEGHLLGRYPDNMVCKWEFRSADEGVVNLYLTTSFFNSSSSLTCGVGDHFVVSDGNRSPAPLIVPLCKNPGVRYQHTSVTGSVLVNMVSGTSGGAYQSFFFRYWSIESCPVTPLVFKAFIREQHRFKGSSFSPQGAGHEQQCHWKITAFTHYVVKLYNLKAEEFQPNCDESKDYLLVDGQRVSICNSSLFRVWSEGETMDITFHTITESARRSFMLDFTVVSKSPCQGHPLRKTIEGSEYSGERVSLRPIAEGDVDHGLLCQWIFTAKGEGNTLQVEIDWAENNRGVPFDKDTCSYPNIVAYSGDTVNASALITPTCSKDKSTIIFKSSSRDMLFMYRREFDAPESGFLMEVNQVRGCTSGGGRGGRDVLGLLWRMMMAGWFALVMVDLAA